MCFQPAQMAVVWKSYTDNHDSYFPPSRPGWYEEPSMMYWLQTMLPYYENPRVSLCPEATKCFHEGGQPPFVAWCLDDDYPVHMRSSYGINLWASGYGDCGWDPQMYWQTPYIRQAPDVPLMFDSNWKDVEPCESDEPPEYEDYWWQPNANEMKRVCINRHNGAVNILFFDFSVRKVGLKKLWRLRWHRQWDMTFPLPVWPEWMQNFEDPE